MSDKKIFYKKSKGPVDEDKGKDSKESEASNPVHEAESSNLRTTNARTSAFQGTKRSDVAPKSQPTSTYSRSMCSLRSNRSNKSHKPSSSCTHQNNHQSTTSSDRIVHDDKFISKKASAEESKRKITATHGPYSFVGLLPPDSTEIFTEELTGVKFFANCALFRTVDENEFQFDKNILHNLLIRKAACTFVLRIDGQEGLRLFKSMFIGNEISILERFFKQCCTLTLIGTFDTKELEGLNAIFINQGHLFQLNVKKLTLIPHDGKNCTCLKRFLETIPNSICKLTIDFTNTHYAGFQKPLQWILKLKDKKLTGTVVRKFDYLKVCVNVGSNLNDTMSYTKDLSECLKEDGVGIIVVSAPHTKFFLPMKDLAKTPGSPWLYQKTVVHPSLYDDQSSAWFTCYLRRFFIADYASYVSVYVLCRMLEDMVEGTSQFRDYDYYNDCWDFRDLCKSLGKNDA